MHEPLPYGRYLLLTRIGVGGMAEVHLARAAGPAGFEKLLVIKRLLPELAWDPDMADQFVEEARVAANLSHGNIVPVFDFGEVEGSYYIAMEYVEGKNLRALVVRLRKQNKELPLPAALFMTSEVLRGLEYAHSRKARDGQPLNIVHRDISPQNVALSYHGDVKILDFGIAKSASREYQTQAGFVKGKLRYMAPEQAREDRIDCRTDIFAVGAMMHELLCGRRDMPDQNKASLREWLERAEFERPSTLNKYVGPDLDQIVMKAVAPDPDQRYQTAGEMERALRAYMARRYEDYGAQDLATLLREAFASEIEAERAWISRTLEQAPATDDKSQTPGDMFVEKSVTRLELEGDTTQEVHSDSLALGASAEQIGPSSDEEVDGKKEKSVSEIWDKDPNESSPRPRRRSRALIFTVVGVLLLLVGAAYVWRFVLNGDGDDDDVVVTDTPTATDTQVASTSPTQAETPKPTPTVTPTHTISTPTRTRPPTTRPTRRPTPVTRSGFLSVNVPSGWGRVWIDGNYVGTTPLVRARVSAGVHEVTVKRGKSVWKKKVLVEQNGSMSLVAEF